MPLSSKQFEEKFLKNRNRILWGVVIKLASYRSEAKEN